MDKERANLIAAAHFEAPSEASARICFALTEYLQYRELHHDALAVSALSLDSLRALKDRRNEPGAWSNLGYALWQLHRYDEALDAHTTARTLYEQTGNTRGQAVAWDNTGNALRRLHRYDEALDAHTTARTLHEQTGNTLGQAVTWNNIGNALRQLHRYDEALDAHTTARTLHEQTGDTHGQAVAWNNIGTTFRGLHRYDEAVASGRRAVEMLESLGDLTRTGEALGELATSLDAANADPKVVRDAWLRSAGAYDSAGATEKGDQSRANAA